MIINSDNILPLLALGGLVYTIGLGLLVFAFSAFVDVYFTRKEKYYKNTGITNDTR